MNNAPEAPSATTGAHGFAVTTRSKLSRAEATLCELLEQSLDSVWIRFHFGDRVAEVGDPASAPPSSRFEIRVDDPNFATRVLGAGNLGLAESYMEGGWRFESGTLEDLLTVFACARMDEKLRRNLKVMLRVAGYRLLHTLTGAHKNVQRHYDIGNDVYELFLGETMAYTCGYQKTPQDTLEQLQENKFDRICQKIRLQPGDTILDIGCGWGGLLIHAARKYGAKGRGITICKNQASYANDRARQLGLADRVTVDYGDYKDATGVYDKVVSVGMLEHLYQHEHPAYFKHVRKLLASDGWGLVHFMSCVDPTNEPDPFVQKHIFPGSTHPHLSSIIRQLEQNALGTLDVENIARHYLPTAKYWLANYRNNVHRIDRSKYDVRFTRMYEYLLCIYIAGCAAPVSALFQVLFTKDFRRNVPAYRV
ncbi:MAG: class I SAM-dependent methyltransferase [Bryobacteraceae bacterium]